MKGKRRASGMRQNQHVIKVNIPSQPAKLSRNCIAVQRVKVGPARQAFAIRHKLKRELSASTSYAVKNGRLKKHNPLLHLWKRVCYEAGAFFEDINRKLFYGTCTAVATALFVMVFQVNFCFAYNTVINGEQVGVAPGKKYVADLIDQINTEFSPYLGGAQVVEGEPAFLPTIVRKNAYTDPRDFREALKSTSSLMLQAYAISVDGTAAVAFFSPDDANLALETYLAKFRPENAEAEVYTRQQVEIVNQYVPKTLIKSVDAAVIELGGVRAKPMEHSVAEGETVDAIVARHGMTRDRFFALNPTLTDDLTNVQQVVVEYNAPLVEVVTAETVTHDDVIPFQTEQYEDGTLYEGTTRVATEGVEGTMQVVEKVIRINGEIASTDILNQTMISKPVTQTVRVGTKERPADVGTGSFIRPYYGAISSRYGLRRRGNHTGIDYCGTTGDPIKAADNGVVIFSGWSGGYGKVVKIDHQNGYVTYYAHCSSLLVNVGDVVAKGDVIAKLGNTGNSTGPHVHFEIRRDGTPLNPSNFVN